MRVALIGPVYPYRGGISHYTTMLCQALRAEQHDVLMVSFSRQYPRWLFPGESDRDPSKAPLKVDDAKYWIDSLNPLSWLTTFWRIAKFRPQVLVLPWWTTYFAPLWVVLSALVRLFLRCPLVIICHNVLPHETRWWDRSLARAVLIWARRLIVQSDDERLRLMALLPKKRVEVVPHPVYDMFAGQVMSREQARQQLRLDQEAPVLLFFGIVRKHKGLRDILIALPEIRARLGQVVLLIVGEFWEDRKAYGSLIEQLNISDSVLIEDRYIPNEDVAVYFRAADLLVAPYRRATGSGVVQMAIGFGLPVVTTVSAPVTSECEHELIHVVCKEGLPEAVVGCLMQKSRGLAQADAPVRRDDGWARLVASIEGAAGS